MPEIKIINFILFADSAKKKKKLSSHLIVHQMNQTPKNKGRLFI